VAGSFDTWLPGATDTLRATVRLAEPLALFQDKKEELMIDDCGLMIEESGLGDCS
jgi:hypothetical protein